MHIEEAHHVPSSLRQFLRQYAMIVVSILTALAFEHVAVSLHNRTMAQESRARIERELAADAEEIRQSVRVNTDNETAVTGAMRALMAEIKTGKPDSQKVLAVVTPVLSKMVLSAPSWQRDAWDSAIADQSAGHLALADLQRYTEIYSAQRDYADAARLLLGGDWLTHASDVIFNLRIGEVDPPAVARIMVRYLLVVGQIANMQRDLDALIAGRKVSPNDARQAFRQGSPFRPN